MPWQPVCRIEEIPPEDVLPVTIDGRALAVCAVDGEYFVFSDRCTHEDVALSGGFLQGCEIECPLHGSRFDLRTGRCLTPPAEVDLATFAARVQDGVLYADLRDKQGDT